MKRARFTREARTEFLAQTACYETLRAGLGARLCKEIEQTALLAAKFPGHGKPGPAGTRCRLVAGLPFKRFDTEAELGTLIHAIAGDQQRPEYWLSRVGRDDG